MKLAHSRDRPSARRLAADEFGDYPAMFARAAWPEFEVETFDVAGGRAAATRTSMSAYLITGSPAGVYEPLPWIEPAASFIRAAEGREDGRRLLRASGDGRGARRPCREVGQGLGRGPAPLFDRSRREPWMDDAAEIAIPASHQDQVVDPAAEHRGRRLGRVHALCRRWPGPTGRRSPSSSIPNSRPRSPRR